MKKLMIAAAIVCAAAFAQAATYDWSASGMAYWTGSQNFDEFSGFKIYAFDASVVTLETVASELKNNGVDVLEQALSPVGAVDGFEYTFSGSGIAATGDGDGYINAFLVMIGTGADGKDYFTSAVIDPVKVTDPVKASGAQIGADFLMDNLPGAGADGWAAVATPEPTSGLLLLLGVAGLALRRRRA